MKSTYTTKAGKPLCGWRPASIMITCAAGGKRPYLRCSSRCHGRRRHRRYMRRCQHRRATCALLKYLKHERPCSPKTRKLTSHASKHLCSCPWQCSRCAHCRPGISGSCCPTTQQQNPALIGFPPPQSLFQASSNWLPHGEPATTFSSQIRILQVRKIWAG